MGAPVIRRRALLGLLALSTGMAGAQPVMAHRRRRHHRPVVVIDAGHGGVDPGAISPRGYQEKTITLRTAWDLVHDLERTRRFRVVMTRRHDTFVPVRRRVTVGRRVKADLFLSIHADALPDRLMRGLSVYTLSARASDRVAAEFAASENKADLIGGVDLDREPRVVGAVLLDLAQRETENLSIALAHDVVEELGHAAGLLDHPQRSADFAVLTAPDVPSVLIELGCLSNPEEEKLLHERGYQKRLARGLARAIEKYVKTHGRH